MRADPLPLPTAPGAGILLRAPNWIGDCVMSLPTLVALRHLRPRARITVATRAPALSVYDDHPDVDGRLTVAARGEGDRDTVRELAAGGFDAAVLLSPSFRSALQVWRAKIPVRVGYADDMRRPLLTHALGKRSGRPAAHQVREYLDLLGVHGARAEDLLPRLVPRQARIAAAGQRLAEFEVLDRPLVALAPFAAGGRTKLWPSYDRLASELIRRGCHVVLVGGPDDGRGALRLADFVAREAGAGHLTLLAGPHALSIPDLAVLAPRLPVLVCNDTGPMHVWAAAGGRVIALFGSSHPGLHGPLGPEHRVFHVSSLPCAGCYKPTCPYDLECLRGISFDRVLVAALEAVGLV
jgi:heptosyltransferase II